MPVGAAAPALLRALVPVPDLLAGLRQGPRRRPGSTPTTPTSSGRSARSNELTRQMFTDWITSQVGDDPDLMAKVIPDYPATGKRTLQDNGSWLRTLTRDNVDLVRTGIDHIEPDAVVTVDGQRHPADVIVYATGFQANRVLWPMRDHRARRGRPARAVGRAAGGLPRHHRARVPEPVLHVRPGHQPGPRRQPDLPLRVPDALHHRSASRSSSPAGTARWSRARTRYDDWHERTQRGDEDAGLVAAVDQAFVLQERRTARSTC